MNDPKEKLDSLQKAIDEVKDSREKVDDDEQKRKLEMFDLDEAISVAEAAINDARLAVEAACKSKLANYTALKYEAIQNLAEVQAQSGISSAVKHVCEDESKDKVNPAADKKSKDQLRYKLTKRVKLFKATDAVPLGRRSFQN